MINKCIALCTLLGMFFGTYLFIDQRYALSETVQKIEQRLDYKIMSDQYNTLDDREWKLTERYISRPIPLSVQEEIRNIRKQKEEIRFKMEKLQ